MATGTERSGIRMTFQRFQVEAQRQLVEGEERPGRGEEIFLAACTAPNLARQAEVMPVHPTVVREDHFVPIAQRTRRNRLTASSSLMPKTSTESCGQV